MIMDVQFTYHAIMRLRQRLKMKYKKLKIHQIGYYMNKIKWYVHGIHTSSTIPRKFRSFDFQVVCVDDGNVRKIITIIL